MGKCNFKNCKKDTYENEERCILHCVKNDYQKDKHKVGFLTAFFEELIEYAVNSVSQYYSEKRFPSKMQIRDYLKGTFADQTNMPSLSNILKLHSVTFQDIFFPERDGRDFFDYKKVLEKIGGVHFDGCKFFASGLDIKNTKLFFQNCTFEKKWNLYDHKILDNAINVLYQTCNFKEDVCTIDADYENPLLENSIFSDCIFSKSIILENIKIKSRLFRNRNQNKLTIQNIYINNCQIEDKCILNNYKINEFKCKNTELNEKLEFKQNTVENFEIDDCNFYKLVDCHGTSFRKFLIKKSIFNDFVGFENCVFGIPEISKNEDYLAKFTYATFISFINFRNAKFLNGLDLVHINLKEPPNFLKVEINPENTPRETYRIIKYSFDKVGNYIEANKFFEYEMKKYKEELKIKKNRTRKLLLGIYELTSNYGQSYIRPIGLTLITAIIYWLLVQGHENNILYSFFPSSNPIIEDVSLVFNNIAKSILPFKRVLMEGMEFVSLLFYIFFASFIWLTILAIKRQTKR